MVVRARRGDFGLESGEASLTEVVITWDDHGRLEAPSASYQEHSATLHLHAPVSVHGPALTLKAGAAQVDAERGSVTLSGPVRGRWEPDHRP